MKPKIQYVYNKKTTSLDIRIKIYGVPAGLYSTGISVDANSFDEEKQICGDISVMAYMTLSKSQIEQAYRPGKTPDQLWSEYVTGSAKNADINDAFNYYLDTMVLESSTRSNFLYTKAKIEAAGLIHTPLKDVTPALVRQFFNGLPGKQSTLFVAYKQLKSVISRYVKDHNLDISVNIDGIIKKPRPKDADEEALEYLTFDEVKDLLAQDWSADKKLSYARDLFVLMCFTGLAIADILKFTPAMVSADGKWILYKRTKTRKRGKQCRVPMLPITRALIYKYEWPTKLARRTIQLYCEKIGIKIGKRVTSHTARHSFGGIMLYFGFSMESVREMMGHSSVAITEQIYAKVTKEKIEREMRTIPKQMNDLLTL
jgi:integrase